MALKSIRGCICTLRAKTSCLHGLELQARMVAWEELLVYELVAMRAHHLVKGSTGEEGGKCIKVGTTIPWRMYPVE